MTDKREGEEELAVDPAGLDGDGRVVFLGRIGSPWQTRAECPKNMREARDRKMPATVEIDAAWRPGLRGLDRASHVVMLTWLDRAPRNLIVQKPRHAPVAAGVFSLRSPARPNPVGLHVARLVSLDVASGLLILDGIDVLDRTPVIDLKPYYASTDAVPDAIVRPAEEMA